MPNSYGGRTREEIAKKYPFLAEDDAILNGDRQRLQLKYLRNLSILMEEIKDLLLLQNNIDPTNI